MSSFDFAEPEALTNTESPEIEYVRRLSERQQKLTSIRSLHQRLLARTNGVNVMAAVGLLPLPKTGTTEARCSH